MSPSAFRRLIVIAAACTALSPAALAQTPVSEPDKGAAFRCDDGSKMVLDFVETGDGLAAAIWLRGITYRLPNLPPEPGPVQIVWSDGEHSLTWSPGVRLMWMASDTHLMCGRGDHKH
jgi:hypothetical protein